MKSKWTTKTKKKRRLNVIFTPREADLLAEMLEQFNRGTILNIFRAGEYKDALDGDGSMTGTKPGGFDKPYKKVVDKLYGLLHDFVESEEKPPKESAEQLLWG